MRPGHIRGGGGPLHWLFESSLLLKSLLALFEVIAGLGLWLVPHRLITGFAGWLADNDLIETREGPVYGHLVAALDGLTSTGQHFYAFYLLGHGMVKLVILALLMRRIAFAYPLGIAVFSGFVALQMLRWTQTHAPMLLVLSALDAMVIALTWREWRAQQHPA